MNSIANIKAGIILQSLLLIVFLSVSCGGGGGALTAPDPNPQDQQQQQTPDPGSPLNQPQAGLVDTTSVVALFNDQTMQFSMGSGVGAALPNASIVIEDPQNFVANTKADADGAFGFSQADVPPNFMTAPGTVIKIYQFDENTLRSEPATVTIQLISV
ncbi:hypothetical protein JW859_15340 [bacterium]|nr:hypothetical protein [bacterium]